MRHPRSYILIAVFALVIANPAQAVSSGWEPPPDVAGDPDYVAGIEAWQQEDWQGAIEHIGKVIERRPWDDDAHNLLGFSYRKLGDFSRALEHYQEALDLNPHHRGALEYLGEAYLEMNHVDQAEDTLARLGIECQRVFGAQSGWQAHCDEWLELKEAIEQYRNNAAD